MAVAVLLSVSATRADEPCADDVKKFCADMKPGGGRIETCLRKNTDKLSRPCAGALAAQEKKVRTLLEEFTLSCQVDVGRLCGSVKPGEGRVLACLVKHEDELSTPCRSQTERFHVAREKLLAGRSACQADIDRLCEGVPPRAGLLVECLQEHETSLSAGCRSVDWRAEREAADLTDAFDELTTQERIMETLDILQGIDSIAFTRSQLALQVENFQGLGGIANADRYTFNPQFVFGHRNEFAIILKVPVLSVYPYTTQLPPMSAVSDITTAFGWAFYSRGQIRQYLGLGLQWKTGAEALTGAAWALEPAYAIAIGLAQWLSVTTEVTWVRSFGPLGNYPELNLLYLRPILTFGLPASFFAALDTKLEWNFANGGTFLPVMRAVAGKFVDSGRSLAILAWYQASLTSESAWRTFPFCFNFGVGLGLSYFFEW